MLGRLSGPLCDQLLDRTGSSEILAELESRGLFTQPLPEMGEYRYHEVLRSHLNATLLEGLGETGIHERFKAAGALLVSSGVIAEAFEAYCRAEDSETARGLLASQGAVVANGAHARVENRRRRSRFMTRGCCSPRRAGCAPRAASAKPSTVISAPRSPSARLHRR